MSSTRARTLKVTNLGKVLKVEESFGDIGGSGTSTFRGIPSLRSFSGGFTKHSIILNRVITVDYIPLANAVQSVALDCAVLVPGVDKLP